ncbi:MAG TPA: tetratricopeptide repeat protein, partial [Isosphaeraceae bacterium]|nr:tetratricopeptide repeat protein [Isosphaeraceae bacterium]
RPFADKALKFKPHHPLASYVKARLLLSIGDDEENAVNILEPALDLNEPNERVIDLLAELKMKAGDLDEAEKLYELARKDDPAHTKWIAGLARVHLRQKKTTQFLNDLAMIAANDADDIAVRKALAERHLGAGDAAAAEKWANECLYIDVYDPSVHLLLAEAQALGKKYTSAIEEFETALALKPKKPNDLKVKLAQAQLAAGQRDAARATVDGVLKADPEHPEAKALREKIEHPTSG